MNKAQQAKGKPKIACVPCARGKRSCSGTHPCDRCGRLGKDCFYPDAEERKKQLKVRRIGLDFMPQLQGLPYGMPFQGFPPGAPIGAPGLPGAGGLGALGFPGAAGALAMGTSPATTRPAVSYVTFTQPRPSKLSLPPQLFPWQDIRLYAVTHDHHHGGAGGDGHGHAGDDDGTDGRARSVVTALAAAASAVAASDEGDDDGACVPGGEAATGGSFPCQYRRRTRVAGSAARSAEAVSARCARSVLPH
jgi:hypothetical protein